MAGLENGQTIPNLRTLEQPGRPASAPVTRGWSTAEPERGRAALL